MSDIFYFEIFFPDSDFCTITPYLCLVLFQKCSFNFSLKLNIRSVLTYAAPVFFYALPKYLKDELVRVEKRAMSIICPGLPYQEAIESMTIVPIVDFIKRLCSNTFDTIIKVPEHRLNRLIQFSGPSRYSLRCNRRIIVPKCKTDRFRNTFIIRSCIDNIYT